VLVDESKGVYLKVEMSRWDQWKAFRCFPSLREPIAFDDTEKYDGHIMLDPTRLPNVERLSAEAGELRHPHIELLNASQYFKLRGIISPHPEKNEDIPHQACRSMSSEWL
jgi:hypothetical protein